MKMSEKNMVYMIALVLGLVFLAGFSAFVILMLNMIGLEVAYSVKNILGVSILVISANVYNALSRMIGEALAETLKKV